MQGSINFIFHLFGFGLLITALIGGLMLEMQFRSEREIKQKIFITSIIKKFGILSPFVSLLMLATGIGNMYNMYGHSFHFEAIPAWLTAKIIFFAVLLVNGAVLGSSAQQKTDKVLKNHRRKYFYGKNRFHIENFQQKCILFLCRANPSCHNHPFPLRFRNRETSRSILMIALRFVSGTLLLLFVVFHQQIFAQEIWQGSLTAACGRQIPFRLVLDFRTQPPQGYFLNGSEQTKIPEIYFRTDSLALIFSEYKAAMIGTWTGSAWHGSFYRYRSDTTAYEFSALPEKVFRGKIREFRFRRQIQGVTSLIKKLAIVRLTASFWTADGSVYGTFIAPDGDEGLFAGTRREDTITLSRFTGWQANLMEIGNKKGIWKGTLTSRSGPPQEFMLTPIQSQSDFLKEEISTTMKRPKDRFSFSGTTDAGDTICSDGTRFNGKAVIVDIMGTWCHNCMDAAPLLQELYTEFRNDGLEVVALTFEISSDPSLAKKNISLFRKRYGITYPILYCGSTQEANIAARLHSQLNSFSAFPTAIFIDKQGTVRFIHAGFHGKGTGGEYRHQVEKYYSLVKTILQTKKEE